MNNNILFLLHDEVRCDNLQKQYPVYIIKEFVLIAVEIIVFVKPSSQSNLCGLQ